jgi:hypothetical protein
MLNHRRYAAIGGIAGILIAAGAAAGCTTTTATKTAPPPAANGQPSTPAPSKSANSTTGPVGTTYKVTDTAAGSSGNQTASYTVQATQVIDPAAPANSFDAAPSGQHLVGVEFVIHGVSGNETDDANNNAVMQGSNGQDYMANFSAIAAGTNFNSGSFNTSPGTSVTGWVNFQVPDGVTVANVQWSPGASTGGTTVTWTK